MTVVDLYSSFRVEQLISPARFQAVNSPFISSGVAVRPCYQTLIILSIGQLVGSSTLDVKLQECDTDSEDDDDWADVSGGAFAQYTSMFTDSVKLARLVSTKRLKYIRVYCETALANTHFAVTAVESISDSANSTTPDLIL